MNLLILHVVTGCALRLQSIDIQDEIPANVCHPPGCEAPACNHGCIPHIPHSEETETIVKPSLKIKSTEQSIEALNTSVACMPCYGDQGDWRTVKACESLGCYGRVVKMLWAQKNYVSSYHEINKRFNQWTTCADKTRYLEMWFEGYVTQLYCNHCFKLQHTGVASNIPKSVCESAVTPFGNGCVEKELQTFYVKFVSGNKMLIYPGGPGNNDMPGENNHKACDTAVVDSVMIYKDESQLARESHGGQPCADLDWTYDGSQYAAEGYAGWTAGAHITKLAFPKCI